LIPKSNIEPLIYLDERRFLMTNGLHKSLMVITIIGILLISCASAQRKHGESSDAEFYINRGISYYERGQYDQAMSDYNKALGIDPGSAKACYKRGIICFKKGEYDQAISDYTKTLGINPRYPNAHYNRGHAYAANSQYDQAILDFSKTLEIDPRDAEAYYSRAVCYYYQRGYEKSWEDVNKAQGLGLTIPPEFLFDLRRASGTEK
jgi:tetratricopeptide (TPR) repeat protein